MTGSAEVGEVIGVEGSAGLYLKGVAEIRSYMGRLHVVAKGRGGVRLL